MAFLITASTTLLWLASATGFDPASTAGSLSIPGQSIDLLLALGPFNDSWVGVTLEDVPKSHPNQAYLLQGKIRTLKLPQSSFRQVSDLLRSTPDFTIFVRLKQESDNVGTIISFAQGANRYLELQSSGRKNETRLYYTVQSKVYSEIFPYRLADDNWHDVAVSVSGHEIQLLVDCNSLFKKTLATGPPDRIFPRQTQLWIGQRNEREHFHFKGLMHEVRLIGRTYGYLESCPDLDSPCPTCGQFVLLQNSVQEMARKFQELSERMLRAEKRILELEKCDCNKSCYFNESIYADGASWNSSCNICSCVHGVVKCHPMKCPQPNCKHPVIKEGECCQSCLKHCLFGHEFFDHGEQTIFQKCQYCRCNDGSMKCIDVNPLTDCPKLNCPPEVQFSVPNQCCKFCPDIDECKQKGGLDGHHCNQNTTCVNTPGSYVCECLPGYKRIDAFNCAEVDECNTGEHNCDVHAKCLNTRGSFKCICQDGYTGDGFSCKPVCNQKCLNGGVCISPDRCACAKGYTGNSCEFDLDECATKSHRCSNSSECVNMIGWYYCQCKEGYEHFHKDNNLGTKCLDINECDKDSHTCHSSAQCINTIGGFECQCPPNRRDCKMNCLFNGKEIPQGVPFYPDKDQCNICTCHKGVVTCQKRECDCSLEKSLNDTCCPQCNKSLSCRHQELPEVILKHGERWSYQCQTCECLDGQIDCWSLKCPPVLCENPYPNPEGCCPYCKDPCLDTSNTSSPGLTCTYAGKVYESGARVCNPKGSVACDCKDGNLCCSYTVNCSSNSRPIEFDGVVATENETPNSASATSDVAKQSSVVRIQWAIDGAGFNFSDSKANETPGG